MSDDEPRTRKPRYPVPDMQAALRTAKRNRADVLQRLYDTNYHPWTESPWTEHELESRDDDALDAESNEA